MAIHAYDEIYVDSAQNVLGHAVDFAVMTLGLEPNAFGDAFSVSDASKQFAAGNPAYIAGMNGCELARKVLEETAMPFADSDDVMYLDKSPEYWSGWALAYYQWYSWRSYMEILRAVPLEQIMAMYPTYHEMDVTQFVDQMDRRMQEAYPQTKLRMRRETCGFSQSELSADADVPLRQIQLFEQRQRDINKCAAITLLKLSRSLHCSIEDLMEH